MPRILLIGGDADFNVGDAAIREAMCSALLKARPDVRITLVSSLSDGGRHLPGVVEVLPKGARHAFSQWRAARGQDMVVIGGGGLFQDDDSRVKMPYWAARLATLRSACPLIAGHALGAGPLQHPESRAAAQMACSILARTTVRDEYALGALQPFSVNPLQIVPDPAFMLDPATPDAGAAVLAAAGVDTCRPIVGVVVRRWFHARGGFVPHSIRTRLGMGVTTGAEAMQQLLGEICKALSRLTRDLDAQLVLLPSYLSPLEGDLEACRALQLRLGTDNAHIVRIAEPGLYKAALGHLKLLVSARMHPLILGSGMGVPLVGIGYNGKFDGCMDALGARSQMLPIDAVAAPGSAAALERCAAIAIARSERVRGRSIELGRRATQGATALLELLN